MNRRYGLALILSPWVVVALVAPVQPRQPVPKLVLQLADPDPATRAAAARELARAEQFGPEADVALHRALADESRVVRGRAALALWPIEPEPVRVLLPGLLAARDDPDEEVRARADAVWAEIGPGIRAALPFVRKSLSTGGDQQALTRAVDGLAKPGLEAVPALLDALADEGGTGGGGVVVTPTGTYYSRAGVGRFAEAAALAMARLGRDAVPTLHEALRDATPALRGAAADALGRIGADAHPAVPTLIGLFNDRDPSVRSRAAAATERLAPAVSGTERALAAEVGHRDPVVRRAVVFALAPSATRRPG